MKLNFLLIALLFFSCQKSSPSNSLVNTSSNLPLAPTALTATLNNNNKVILSWVSNSSMIQGVIIQRKNDTSLYQNLTTLNSNSISSFLDTTVLLNTNYTYRIYSFNKYGNSIDPSNESNIKTNGLPVCITDTVSQILMDIDSVSRVTTYIVNIGTIIKSDGNSVIISKGIVWDTTSSPSILLSTKTIYGNSLGTTISSIKGLKPNTTYYLRAYATNSIGTSYGQTVTIKTPDVSLEKGLQLYYPFNGNILDESGNGNDCAVFLSSYPGGPNYPGPNLTLTTDRLRQINSAYHFNGQSNSLRVLPKKIQVNGSFSISCWVYLENLQPRYNDEAIIGQWNGPLGIGNNFLLSYRNFINDYGIGFYVNSFGNFTTVWDKYNYSLYQKNWYIPESAKWYHIVVTYSEGNQAQFYINGRLQLSTSNVPTTFLLPNNILEIGHAYSANQDLWFNGSIDEIRIYNRVLSSSEISYLSSH